MTKPESLAVQTIGILGAGKLGVVLAQHSLRAGYDVYIAGSGEPAKIRLSMQVLAQGSHAVTRDELVDAADIIILALPLSKFTDIPADAFAGKLVIDAMNYWWEVDGERDDFKDPNISTSELVQQYFSSARITKAVSHIGYHHLHDEAKPHGTNGRKAIAIASDYPGDAETVASYIDSIGFDPIQIGGLAKGKQLEPGHPAFGAHVDAATLRSYIH